MTALLAAALLIVMTAASAFAAESGVDWSDQKITVQGMGVAPANARTAAQARMLARRAAVVDGYRQIAEIVKGVNVSGETTVENMMVTNDVVKTKVSALVQGARVVSEEATSDGGYIVNMEVSMFGVSDSLASAVLEKPAQQESFPEPVASVAPSTPATVDVHVQVARARRRRARRPSRCRVRRRFRARLPRNRQRTVLRQPPLRPARPSAAIRASSWIAAASA